MKHALRCLAWGWRRRAARIEAKVRTPEGKPASFSDRTIGEAQGFARGLRFCAEAVFKAVARAERKARKGGA